MLDMFKKTLKSVSVWLGVQNIIFYTRLHVSTSNGRNLKGNTPPSFYFLLWNILKASAFLLETKTKIKALEICGSIFGRINALSQVYSGVLREKDTFCRSDNICCQGLWFCGRKCGGNRVEQKNVSWVTDANTPWVQMQQNWRAWHTTEEMFADLALTAKIPQILAKVCASSQFCAKMCASLQFCAISLASSGID